MVGPNQSRHAESVNLIFYIVFNYSISMWPLISDKR